MKEYIVKNPTMRSKKKLGGTQMKRILFHYYNLEYQEEYVYGILNTSVELAVIQALLGIEKMTFEQMLDVVDKKDSKATFVRITGTPLKLAESLNADIQVEVLFNLSIDKYIEIESAK